MHCSCAAYGGAAFRGASQPLLPGKQLSTYRRLWRQLVPSFYVMGDSACATAGWRSAESHDIPKRGRRAAPAHSQLFTWALRTEKGAPLGSSCHRARARNAHAHGQRTTGMRALSHSTGATICQQDDTQSMHSALKQHPAEST